MTINVPSPTPRELILVAEPKAGLRIREGKVSSIIEGVNVAPLRELLRSTQAEIRPLYGVSEEWLKHRTCFTKIMMGVGQRLDLSIFYQITCPDDGLVSLAAGLRELPIVQSAYIKPGASLPWIDTDEAPAEGPPPAIPTKDFTGHQGYLNAASEGGIDARYAWTKEGGCGRGVKIIDVEGAWRFSHEDLLENPSGCVGGVPISKPKWRRHGTAVLGMLGGDHNGYGIAGICPDADVKTVSIFGNSAGTPSDWNSAAAIRLAADMLRPGSIILIEDHRPGPAVNFEENEVTQRGYIPIEWWPCDMAAILYANSRGIIVVEAGGNGRQDLDDPIYSKNPPTSPGPFPPWWRNPFKRDPIDTKAIVVGAGLPPGSSLGPDRSRWELSNHGTVIDTQGWGLQVATCGGNGDLTPLGTEEDRQYTRRFRGTSSAAAMVTGALGCLQGVLRARGRQLDPATARALLQDNRLNSPQQDGPLGPTHLEPIGPRPNLRKLINHVLPRFSFTELIRALKKALFGQRFE